MAFIGDLRVALSASGRGDVNRARRRRAGLRNGELEFAIVQSDVAYAALHGEGAFAGRPLTGLRSVLVLYPELVTIISRDDSAIRTIGDLPRKRINVGRQGSGTRATWEALEAALGWSEGDQAKAVELPGDSTVRALCQSGLQGTRPIEMKARPPSNPDDRQAPHARTGSCRNRSSGSRRASPDRCQNAVAH